MTRFDAQRNRLSIGGPGGCGTGSVVHIPELTLQPIPGHQNGCAATIAVADYQLLFRGAYIAEKRKALSIGRKGRSAGRIGDHQARAAAQRRNLVNFVGTLAIDLVAQKVNRIAVRRVGGSVIGNVCRGNNLQVALLLHLADP